MKILLYTDSRGNNVRGEDHYAHYPAELSRMHDVEAHLCPHKWTTIPDFLDLWERRRGEGFDAVILHAGVVDAAPRPQRSALGELYPLKKPLLDRLFGESAMYSHLRSPLGTTYEGDETVNLYSWDMADRAILPRLAAIPNLIYIGGNRLIPGWRGTYWRDRPENVRLLEPYLERFAARLPRSLCFMHWSEDEVKRRTFDAVHLSAEGSRLLLDGLRPLLEDIQQTQAHRTAA